MLLNMKAEEHCSHQREHPVSLHRDPTQQTTDGPAASILVAGKHTTDTEDGGTACAVSEEMCPLHYWGVSKVITERKEW